MLYGFLHTCQFEAHSSPHHVSEARQPNFPLIAELHLRQTRSPLRSAQVGFRPAPLRFPLRSHALHSTSEMSVICLQRVKNGKNKIGRCIQERTFGNFTAGETLTRASTLPPTTMKQHFPFLFLLSPPFASPSPFKRGARWYHPRDNFGIKDDFRAI